MHVRRSTCPRFLPVQHVIVEEQKQLKLKMVNQYLLLTKLGSGAFSKVYLSQDDTTSKYYAAKAVHVHERRHNGPGAAGLEREIRIMRILNHPNIVALHDVLYASTTDTAYLFMEWAECGSLQQAIQKGIKFEENILAGIFKQIVEGLSYLHSQGIVHRDIKPSNILLFLNGSVKLSDFGIGHTFQSAETVIGTPAYQAPELLEDEEEDFSDIDIDPTKGDVWSLGVSLYEAAYGSLPYYGQNLYEIVNKINNTPLVIPENRKYSDNFIDLLLKMLHKNPDERISLDDIKNHPFFEGAQSSSLSFRLRPFQPPPRGTTQVMKIMAIVCPENYSFAGLRSVSCPSYATEMVEANSSYSKLGKTKSLD
ncbi:CAMK family protein kinase [Tritrichomonas foetus]|uniref:CAMK family protein kinase n=1 Tax=Tritrichomonas foetus TaxID=1144522 RepID=A0A1J4KAK6_9EUKA|nr:CAMK family protein kinase [Tritrichomonas foetus]|eukprot:OHT06694.1 CAMK family protein kinase [Tritrichomonas foetus]